MTRRGRILARVALAALVVVLALGALSWWWVTDRPSGNPPLVAVVIPKGAGHDAIMERLESAHLVDRPFVTRLVFKLEGTFPRIQAGVHQVPGDANALELARLLTDPPSEVQLTLIPGQSVWEAADRMAALGIGTRDEVLALAADEAFARDTLGLHDLVGPARAVRPDGVAPTWLEGFLYPETYNVGPGTSPRDALERAVRQFQRVWRELRASHAQALAALQARGFSEAKLIVLASLVEEETADPTEARRVAGVFYNRLGRGMRLETDPTLMYRPDRVGRPPTPTERRDASNPYNTYATAGLPPGPICSPGRTALEAVLDPESHDFLFFVARRDGTGGHAFAATLDEHQANIDRYLRKVTDP
ncbi:MAG: endolytic transglycosylase MltG [Myxococcota bacterium]